ncbi:MAG: alpha-1,2-mannosidase/glycoside hydrolase family 92 protein [Bacteroidales bacterium]
MTALKRIVLLLPAFMLWGEPVGAQRLSDYVDPFIGATTGEFTVGSKTYLGLGKTFPGAASPFGLVQLSPNTITGGDNGPGYSYEHTSIEGFAFTQMSGIGWFGDLGNFLVMPATGELKVVAGGLANPDEGYRSRYNKSTEQAKAGYYAADLTDYGIRAEATVTPRAGMLRFTYPANRLSRIQIDLARRVAGASAWQKVKVVDEHTITGYMQCTPDEGGWGNGAGNARYTVYFYARFSKPLKHFGVWSAPIPEGQSRKLDDVASDAYREIIKKSEIIRGVREYEGKHLGFFTEFETGEGEQVLMKAGISFVSEEGAQKNLEAEIAGWDFDEIREQARTRWDKALGKMTVAGGESQKVIFYTALYHTMIDPRLYSDVDGKYVGGDGKIHETGYFNKRTIFSGWDVFRSQMPLQTIINPKVVSDMINSLVTLAEESGKEYLERWELLNAYSGCMVGNPAISVIADAYAKGIRNYDIDKAYKYAALTTEKFGNGTLGYTRGDDMISTTLEHAYTEWCMSELARMLGKESDRAEYLRRSESYKNIWDGETRWFRPKTDGGAFKPLAAKGRLHEGYGSVESNPFQQGWFVPHDIPGLVGLIGGRKAAVAELDYMFDNTPADYLWNDFYNHSNEPVHHIPFLYNRLGEPWKTQARVRHICANAYKEGVMGLVGNEDVGQMSAWYVLAASGIHPVCPGETRFELTTPVFGEIRFNLDNGKVFIISAKNNTPENVYIQSAKLNGKDYGKCYIDYRDIMQGGKLELLLGAQPTTKWGVEP